MTTEIEQIILNGINICKTIGGKMALNRIMFSLIYLISISKDFQGHIDCVIFYAIKYKIPIL